MADGMDFGLQCRCIKGSRDYKGCIYGQGDSKFATYTLNFGTVLVLRFAEPMKMEGAAATGSSVLWWHRGHCNLRRRVLLFCFGEWNSWARGKKKKHNNNSSKTPNKKKQQNIWCFSFLFSDVKVVGCLAIRSQMEEGLAERWLVFCVAATHKDELTGISLTKGEAF